MACSMVGLNEHARPSALLQRRASPARRSLAFLTGRRCWAAPRYEGCPEGCRFKKLKFSSASFGLARSDPRSQHGPKPRGVAMAQGRAVGVEVEAGAAIGGLAAVTDAHSSEDQTSTPSMLHPARQHLPSSSSRRVQRRRPCAAHSAPASAKEVKRLSMLVNAQVSSASRRQTDVHC
jgi:hypothetical protein